MIFVDCGANVGQTLEEVTKPTYAWDSLLAFEPDPVAHKILRHIYPEVTTYAVGLSDHTGVSTLYGDNANIGASIYSTKTDIDPSIHQQVPVWEASSVIGPLTDVVLKLNCEGAEIPILNNLLDTGAIDRCINIMVDFDIRRCAGHEDEEGLVRTRLDNHGVNYHLAEIVMVGSTHQDRIRNWLTTTGVA